MDPKGIWAKKLGFPPSERVSVRPCNWITKQEVHRTKIVHSRVHPHRRDCACMSCISERVSVENLGQLPFIFSIVVLITDKHTMETKQMQLKCAFMHYVTMTVFLFQINKCGENAVRVVHLVCEYEFRNLHFNSKNIYVFHCIVNPDLSTTYWNNALNPFVPVALVTATYQGEVLKIKQVWYPVAPILPLLRTFVRRRAQVHGKAVYTKTRRGDKKHFASPPWCHKLLCDLSSRMGVGGRWMKGGMEGGWEKKVRVRFIILGGRSKGPGLGEKAWLHTDISAALPSIQTTPRETPSQRGSATLPPACTIRTQ